MRTACVALTALLLTAPAAWAGEKKGLEGNWTVAFYERGLGLTPWLLKVDSKDGKPEAALTKAEKVGASELEDFRLEGKKLTFTIKLGPRAFRFEFLVPRKPGKYLLGTMQVGTGQVLAARLEATKDEKPTFTPPKQLPKFDYEQARELVGKAGEDPRGFDAAAVLFGEAKKNKATAEDVKAWAESLLAAAEKYGPRWAKGAPLRIAGAVDTDAYPAVAEQFARRIVKDLPEKATDDAQLLAYGLLELALEAGGKKEELTKVRARIHELEEKGHKAVLENFPFKPEPAPQRKGTRAVLVELFTGAMCPPCVAADMAFDGLEKTFKPSEVVLLQYHLHIPGPDALTNPDTQGRQKYYAGEVRGTPSIFFNGKAEAGGGGFRPQAEGKYKAYLEVVAPLLEKKAGAEIKGTAVRKGDKIDITAEVGKLEKPGEKVRLRLALVQELVRYPGGNGLVFHSRVVRAMPGGTAGFALTKDSAKHTASVDLKELRRNLRQYLAKHGPYPTALPLRFGELRVVAFVQDDETRDVLQAIEVPVKE
jgi:hypothetical protein